VEPGNGRDQRADPGRNANRDVQDVVEHECGGRQKPRPDPQILLRDGVGPAASRIRGDCLPIGKVQQGEQGDDDGDDRADISEAAGTQWQHDRQRGLGPIGGRRETIEAENGNPGRDSDFSSSSSEDASGFPSSLSRIDIVALAADLTGKPLCAARNTVRSG
jgi:hypothetical protein